MRRTMCSVHFADPPRRAAPCRRLRARRRWRVGLTVHEGETVGLVGESGSGKTTMALAALRLEHGDGRDRVRRRGSRRRSTSAHCGGCARDMQIVFQDPFGSLSPRMTVGDIVAEGLRCMSPAQRGPNASVRVAAALEEVGLPADVGGPLSARVQRRPAAAHRDRARHGAEAALRGAGRTDQRAGHVGAGADRRSVARAAAATTVWPICSSVMI